MYSENRTTFCTMKKKLKRSVTALVLLLCAGGVFAQSEGAKWTELSSRHFLSGGASTASFDFADTLTANPASSGYIQRMTFDGSYIALINTAGGFGWPGHIANFSHTVPTRHGVLSWHTQLLASGAADFDAGSVFSLGGTFARDVYPGLLVGAGIETRLSSAGEVAADADLGFISDAGDLAGFEEVYWGAALRGLGYSAFQGVDESLYTPSFGIRGAFINTDSVTSSLMADLSFPRLLNARLGLGVETVIGGSFRLLFGSRADAREIAGGNYAELIPSLGISYTFSPGNGEQEAEERETISGAETARSLPWNKNEFSPALFYAPVAPDLWALGIGARMPIGFIDEQPPEIEIELSPQEGDEAVESPEEKSPEEEAEESPEETEGSADTGSVLQDDSRDGSRDSEKGEKLVVRNKRAKSPHAAITRVQEDAQKSEKNGGEKSGSGSAGSSESGSEAGEEAASEESNQAGDNGEVRPFERDARVYISPNNDGVKDELSFSFEVSERRYIEGYEFIIENEAGKEVRSILNKETRPEERSFSTFFSNLFAPKKGVQVPDTLRWDGTTEEGNIAADGLYTFHVKVWDDNGNVGSTDKQSVYVDTTPPQITIEDKPREDRIFSPDGDGMKDTLIIEQDGSIEEQWNGVFLDSNGNEVRSFSWEKRAPERLEWDGKNDAGTLVPDGVYKYRINATDRAGNRTVAEYANIVKNTEKTPVSLTINRSHFSPNEDGVKDEVLLYTDVPVKRGIDEWQLIVFDASGNSVMTRSGTENVPETVVFDGRDDSGNVLEEGSYRARLEVLYLNGNNPQAESPQFVLDVTPPSVSLNANTDIFSPDGDGQKDVIVFNQETSAEETWYGYITNAEDERVMTYKWVEKAPATLRWDGRGETGELLEDGIYYYQLQAQDKAGNQAESRRIRFEMDTEEREVLLTAGSDVFGPNGNGRNDTIRFLPKLQSPDEIVSYRLAVENEAGEEVRVFEESGSVPDTIRWDGFRDDGGRASDGTYRARMRVTYRNGDQPTASTQTFVIDTQKPQIEVEPEYTLFSPDGDGNRDSVLLRQDSSEEELWQAEIRNQAGEVVESAFWKGTLDNFVWDGTDNSGNPVPDGTYSYTVSTEDRAGNRASAAVENITVDTAATRIFVTASSEYLAPTGNGTYEEIAFNTIINRTEGLQSWFLELVDNRGTVQRRFEGQERIPERIVWDGTNENGEYIEGTYTARFGASYRKGNEPRAQSLPFVLDRSAPDTEVNLRPVPFSPDNDGVDDELNISITVEEQSAVEDWTFTIYDPRGKVFKEFSGTGKPAETLIWDGRSDEGELVQSAMDYPYEFTVTDELENTSVTEGEISVDVLVVREDGQLKIKISNINFQPNSAEFIQDDPEIAERNQFVLDRVAEILQKYRQYEITIEGHAVITKWYDEELAQQEQKEELLPLSRERAERVLEALVKRGVSRNRLNAVGVGGDDPLVPHSDIENRWKNRRVEFILEKE